MYQLARHLPLAASLLCSLLFFGCAIDAETLDSWKQTPQGRDNLAGYLIDRARPRKLREKSAEILFAKKEKGYVYLLTAHEELQGEEREFLSNLYREMVRKGLRNASMNEEIRSNAVDFSFLLLSIDGTRSIVSRDDEIFEGLLTWSIQLLQGGRSSQGSVPPQVILSICAMLREEAVAARLLKEVQENPEMVDFAITVNTILSPHQRPLLHVKAAEMLLLVARKSLPVISDGLIQALKENGNITLLRFLLDLAQDERVSEKSRGEALFKAFDQLCMEVQGGRCVALPPEGREGLLRLIRSPRVHRRHIFEALGYFWEVYGTDSLKELLYGINSKQFPVSGEELRVNVESFCTDRVRPYADTALRELFEEIFDNSLESPEKWPASLYSLTCLAKVYPDEFRRLMTRKRRRAVQRNGTRISGWTPGQRISLEQIMEDFISVR